VLEKKPGECLEQRKTNHQYDVQTEAT